MTTLGLMGRHLHGYRVETCFVPFHMGLEQCLQLVCIGHGQVLLDMGPLYLAGPLNSSITIRMAPWPSDLVWLPFFCPLQMPVERLSPPESGPAARWRVRRWGPAAPAGRKRLF